MSGAAPLGAELVGQVAERIDCKVIQGYGLTETSPVTHVIRPHGENRPGSIGPPSPGPSAAWSIRKPARMWPRASAASSGSGARR